MGNNWYQSNEASSPWLQLNYLYPLTLLLEYKLKLIFLFITTVDHHYEFLRDLLTRPSLYVMNINKHFKILSSTNHRLVATQYLSRQWVYFVSYPRATIDKIDTTNATAVLCGPDRLTPFCISANEKQWVGGEILQLNELTCLWFMTISWNLLLQFSSP